MSEDTFRHMSDNTRFSQILKVSFCQLPKPLTLSSEAQVILGIMTQSHYSLVNKYQTRRERKWMEKIEERWNWLKDLVGEKGEHGGVTTIFLWKIYTRLLMCHFPCQGEYVLSQMYAFYRCFVWTREHLGAMSTSLESWEFCKIFKSFFFAFVEVDAFAWQPHPCCVAPVLRLA